MPQRFTVAEDDCMINAVVIDIDERIGKANSIRRINLVVKSN